MNESLCTRCGRTVPGHDGVHQSDGKGHDLGFVCGRCWSRILADVRGEDVEHIELAPIRLMDGAGREHEFHFRYNPAPRGLEAFELVDGVRGGYQFQVLQEDDDPALVAKLLERMRRGLARQHLEPSKIGPGGWSVRDLVVRGRIEWDEEAEEVPLLFVDGNTLSWREFGRMLMTFEGWQFRLEMIEPSDEA